MKINIKVVVALLVLSSATRANAQTRQDGVNDFRSANVGHFGVVDVGYFYVPTFSYWLNQVQTYFALPCAGCAAQPDRTVTLEILTAPRSDGGTLLRAASFNSEAAHGMLGGPTFAAIQLTAGASYFVGFRNVAGLGANLTSAPAQPASLFRYEGSPYSTGAYDQTQDLLNQGTPYGPILRFLGTVDNEPISVVPEPSTAVLAAAGLLGLAVARSRRRSGR